MGLLSIFSITDFWGEVKGIPETDNHKNPQAMNQSPPPAGWGRLVRISLS